MNDGSIVFLTDGSPESLTALPAASALAGSLASRFTVIHQLGDGSNHAAGDRRIAAALGRLPGGAPGVLAVPEDRLHPTLTSLAEAAPGMLVLLPTRRGGLSRILAGNVYEQLLRGGPLPVLALPAAGQLKPIARILFPADFSPRSEAAFEQALSLASRLGAELHILHVYGEDGLVPSETDVARRAAAKSPRELMAIDQESLSALIGRAQASRAQARSATAEGRAHAAILAYAAANAIDLIVMASHGPRNAEDILFGSTTVRVIKDAPVPVLAMRA